jgi:hypothetical protein
MVKKPAFKHFFSEGYFIYKIKNKKYLNILKKKIIQSSKSLLKQRFNAKNFFDNFHKLKIFKKEENEFRMKLMEEINKNSYGAKIGYRIFSDIIDRIFGKDIVSQKNINLVIQCPKDKSQMTVHRDSPPNSLYEIVVWVPLSKTYKTKNMYILNKKETVKIYDLMKSSIKKNKKYNKIMNDYFNFAFKKSNSFNLSYGEALIFWAPLVHCVEMNRENETRFSLNFRYKNTYTPYGTKGFIDYFQVANTSTVTRLVLEKQSKLHI